jgi:proteasome assembly chaperone 3
MCRRCIGSDVGFQCADRILSAHCGTRQRVGIAFDYSIFVQHAVENPRHSAGSSVKTSWNRLLSFKITSAPIESYFLPHQRSMQSSSRMTTTPDPPPPILSFSLRQAISGIDTSLLIQSFDDRILVIVTQNGKVGCLVRRRPPLISSQLVHIPDPFRHQIQASLPSIVSLPPPPPPATNAESRTMNLPPPPDSLLLTPVLGTPPDQTLYHVYASQIATLVWWALQEVGAARRAVVLGLALDRGTSPGRLSGVANGVGRTDDGKDGEDGGGVLGDGERERFEAVMGMVAAWPGPGGTTQHATGQPR